MTEGRGAKPTGSKPKRPSKPAPAPKQGTVRSKKATKRIDLAFQGGGAHGAFTWGVVDRLLEEEAIEVAGICGTSAGAMNAVVTAYGLAIDGKAGARERLRAFWTGVAEIGRSSPLQPTPLEKVLAGGNTDFSLAFQWYDNLTRVFSPYQLNPMNYHPLRGLLEAVVDFDVLRAAEPVKLFLCATNVLKGKIRVFERCDITLDAVLASGCLPFLFQAVEIDGEYYWDGGYMGNPPIYPLIYETDCSDILIVQINPINIQTLPTSAQAILDRINTLSFNSSLMREMRAINFVSKLIDNGQLDPTEYKKLRIHSVDAEVELGALGVSSKLNADWDFIHELFELGRSKADAFISAHLDDIGKRSSTDIVEKFL